MSVARFLSHALMPALLTALVACKSERPGPTEFYSSVSGSLDGPGGALQRFPEILDSVPPVQVSTADDPLPPELSDEDLIQAVTRSNGRVVIGLKLPGHLNARATGIVPAMKREHAIAARASLRAAGVTITRTFRNSSAISATIEPQRAPVLRRLPVVNYLEPAFGAALQALPEQDTAWGLPKAYVPQVWPGGFWGAGTRGGGAFVTVVDNGVDEIHRYSGDGPADMVLDCYYVDDTGTDCYNRQTSGPGVGHGVHVAGTINASDNGVGWIGVAPALQRFASIKVCDANNYCSDDWVASALDWVLAQNHPRRIVNMSLGFCQDFQFIREWVHRLDSAGVLIIASAGNYNAAASYSYLCGQQTNHLPNWQTSVMFPARYAEVMAVSGSTPTDSFPVPPSTRRSEPRRRLRLPVRRLRRP